jgi:hypothetical protein
MYFLKARCTLPIALGYEIVFCFWFLFNLFVFFTHGDRQLLWRLCATFEYLFLCGNVVVFSVASFWTDLVLEDNFYSQRFPLWNTADRPLFTAYCGMQRFYPMMVYIVALSVDAFPTSSWHARMAFAVCICVFPTVELYQFKVTKAAYTRDMAAITWFAFRTDAMQLAAMAATNMVLFGFKAVFRTVYHKNRLHLLSVTYDVTSVDPVVAADLDGTLVLGDVPLNTLAHPPK